VQHGENCWFYAPLTNAYREIHNHNSDISVYGIRIHSVEVWERNVIGEGGERVSGCESESGGVNSQKRLVAGEIGYTVGGCYTSLSGFRLPDADGAGTVQCCAVAKLLIMCGFKMWDLGMGMIYKYDLGAKDIPRNDFLSLLSSMRDMPCTLILENSISAVDLLKGDFKK
jgi:Leu/Phe-tRNA-protein transferase